MTGFMTRGGTGSGLRRRTFLAGALGSSVLFLPGCESVPGLSLVDAIRRLLQRSSEQAFARLVVPGGYWDQAVAEVGVAGLLGTRGNALTGVLASTLFKDRLETAFAGFAATAAERAAPLVADRVRMIGVDNALELVRGGPNAATGFLQANMGTSLIEVMVPELGQALRITSEPLVGELLAALTGIDVNGAARNLAGSIDRAIWREIGLEEAAIRANPAATNDPLLIGVFGAAAQR